MPRPGLAVSEPSLDAWMDRPLSRMSLTCNIPKMILDIRKSDLHPSGAFPLPIWRSARYSWTQVHAFDEGAEVAACSSLLAENSTVG